MKLIVGLGNPGLLYARSRHNIGSSVVKALAKVYKIHLKRDTQAFALSGKGKIDRQNVILAIPLTFMNLSGGAVSSLIKRYKIDFNNLLVVCDDLDLEFGRLRIRPEGSSGGHRGLASVTQALRGQDFARLRIGIGRPARPIAPAEYVLTSFGKREKAVLTLIQERAIDCCRMWANEGITQSMTVFNRRTN